MIHSIIHFISTVLIPLGSLGIFLGSAFSEVFGFIPPLSMIVGAGYNLSHHSQFSFGLLGSLFFFVALPDALGATVGSYITYGLGYLGGKPAILRIGKYIGVSWHQVEKAHTHFEKHQSDGLLIFLLRAVPLVPHILINIVCGLLRIPVLQYTAFSFSGSLVRSFVYALIGWSLGDAYRIYGRFVGTFEYNSIVFIAILVAIFFIWRFIDGRMKKHTSGTI